MSKAITERHDERGPGGSWGPSVETAPSILRDDEPTLSRMFGLIGLCIALVGAVFLILNMTGDAKRFIGIGWASMLLTMGGMASLAHAAYDRDLQVRRLYWSLGLLLLAGGIVACLLPVGSGVGSLFGAGYPAIGVALLFLMATLHHETDLAIRKLTIRLIGFVGLVGFTLVLVLGNNFWQGKDFLVPNGLLIGLMSIVYMAAFITLEGISSDVGYRGALLLGFLGVVAFLIGFLRWTLPIAFSWFDLAAPPRQYLVPYGLIFMGLGLIALGTSLAAWSDNRFVVLTKRELGALFYSPVIYILIIGLAFIGWILFLGFFAGLIEPDPREGPLIEPIVARYLLNLLTVSVVILVVPVITMRLLSEEKRSGTMEVMLTAPVSETAIVFSKYFAALIVFFLVWVPWGLFLVGLRVGGGQPFDYYALLAFFVAVLVSGANFVAMGLFFSSLTQNQIIAAVASFTGMMSQLMLFFAQRHVEAKSALQGVIEHVSYPQLWINSFQGILMPTQILFQLSFAVFWLFLTLKVLEARKWS